MLLRVLEHPFELFVPVEGGAGVSTRSRSGAISGLMAYAHATCSQRPNQDLAPWMSFGEGKSRMAASMALLGLMCVSVCERPANSTSLLANLNLVGLNVMPFLAHEAK